MNPSNLESGQRPRASRAAEVARIDPWTFAPDHRALRLVAPVLNSLALPEVYIDLMLPGLRALGCTLEVKELEQTDGGEPTVFRFTLVRRNSARRALLYIEDEILTVFNRNHKVAVQEVRDLLQSEHETLFIFHHANPAPAYKNLMSGAWKQKYRVSAKFLAFSDIDGFASLSGTQQADYLRRELLLEEEETEGAGPSKPKISSLPPQQHYNEFLKPVLEILSNHPQWLEARQRRVLVQLVGLQLGSINFEGAPETVAGEVVLSPSLTAQNKETLLRFLQDHADTPQDSRTVIEAILERFSFD